MTDAMDACCESDSPVLSGSRRINSYLFPPRAVEVCFPFSRRECLCGEFFFSSSYYQWGPWFLLYSQPTLFFLLSMFLGCPPFFPPPCTRFSPFHVGGSMPGFAFSFTSLSQPFSFRFDHHPVLFMHIYLPSFVHDHRRAETLCHSTSGRLFFFFFSLFSRDL